MPTTTSYLFNPVSILTRLTGDPALQYLTHLRDDHDDHQVWEARDCPTCYTALLAWLIEGTITFAELRANPIPAPAATPAVRRPTPARDVLDNVGEDGGLLCACGCRRPITATSPSAYFASQTCSEQWHDDQVHPTDAINEDEYVDPAFTDDWYQEVLLAARGRPEPVDHTTGPWPTPRRDQHQGVAAWLNQVNARWARHTAMIPGGGNDVTVVIAELCTDTRTYTRYCDTCTTWVPPATLTTGPEDTTCTFTDVQQTCPTCQTGLTGRPMLGWIEPDGNDLRLHLEDGTAHTSTLVHATADHVDTTIAWRNLEAQLIMFTGSYQPPAAHPAPGDDLPYQLDLPTFSSTVRRRIVLPWTIR